MKDIEDIKVAPPVICIQKMLSSWPGAGLDFRAYLNLSIIVSTCIFNFLASEEKTTATSKKAPKPDTPTNSKIN